MGAAPRYHSAPDSVAGTPAMVLGPVATENERKAMKADIHPETNRTAVSCTCGNSFTILSRHDTLSVDICSACHPFYTGTQKFVDSAGRVDAFTKRFQWNADQAAEQAKKKNQPKPTKRVQKDLKLELEKKKVFGKKKVIPELEGKGDKRDDRR